MSERLAKIEGDTPRPAAAAPAPPSQPAPAAEPPPTQLSPAQVPPPQDRRPSRRPGAPWLCCWRRVSLSLPWSCRPMAAGIVARWAPQLGSTRSSPPESPTLAAQSAPSIVQVAAAETGNTTGSIATDNATPGNIPGSGADRAARCRAAGAAHQQPPRLPIKPSCCKRSRAISRRWSGTSNSSRRTSSKWPPTIQKPLASSRPARKK